MASNKRAQEEIVGFVIIVVIVSIVLLFFLVFSLSSNRENVESYKASSFLQAALAYTSSCEDREFLSVQDLIVSCYNEERCKNEEYSCDVLNETLISLLRESWPIGPDFPEKGYKFEVFSGEETIILISEGNITRNLRGAPQIIPESGAQIRAYFTAYS